MDGRERQDDRTGGVAGPPPLGRRAAVAGTCAAACLAALGGLAACAVPGRAAPAPEPEPGGSQPPTGLDAGSPGAVVGPASEVPVGGGRIYPALELVVTQPVAGTWAGFTAACTHDGCIVDRVVEGLITCPCHGSRFRLDGTVERGPATSRLAGRPVRVMGASIVLA